MPEGTESQNCTEEKTTFTLTEFKELVLSAQKWDRKAIDTLCNAFKPLIYSIAYRYEIRQGLGEDAVNAAWVIFLEVIMSYHDNNYCHLPGLLQYHVYYELLHSFTRTKSVKESVFLDDDEDDNCFQLADEKNDIDQMVNNQLLANAMKDLTDTQKNVIKEVFFEDKTMQSCGDKYGISRQACFIHKERALKKLKQALTA